MKKHIAFIVFIAGIIVAVVKLDGLEKKEYIPSPPYMPRSKSIFGMEIGDVEYLQLEKEMLQKK